MMDSGIFDKLASDLSLDERQELLEKLKTHLNFSDEPLYFEDKGLPAEETKIAYLKLPWFYRFFYNILGFFKSKSPLKIFEDQQVSALGNRIDELSPGLYDYQNYMLLPAFQQQLIKLKEAAQFFYTALDSSVNRDRMAFFAFLGSLEMPDVHKRLLEETDPRVILEKYPDSHESEQRQLAFKALEDGLAMIGEDYRRIMYYNARSLFCLKELSSFLYDRLIMAFAFNKAAGGEVCSIKNVRDLLVSLSNILLSLKVVPPLALLKSLFVFILQEKAGEPGFDVSQQIRKLMAKAESSLTVIREFNKQVPLVLVLRCSGRDMSIAPREISGGEDWFIVYKEYWRKRIESLFAASLRERRSRKLLGFFREFFKGKNISLLENSLKSENPGRLPVKGALALTFLYNFYTEIFIPEINQVLQPILADGDFEKNENRFEFSEAYSNLSRLREEIMRFEEDISFSGDFGKRYSQVRQIMASMPVKRRKIQIILEEAQEGAEKILQRAREAILSIVNVLNGILGKDTKGKYFPLTNLAKVTGKNNQFIFQMAEIIGQFQTVLKLLDDINIMESEFNRFDF